MLTALQKAAVVLTAVTVVAFAVALVMLLSTPREEGADIGAGMVLLLAVLCSLTGAGLFVASPERTAMRAAVASVVLWVA